MSRLASAKVAVVGWVRHNPVQAVIFALVGLGFMGGVFLSQPEHPKPTAADAAPVSSVTLSAERHDDLVYADGTRYRWDGIRYRNANEPVGGRPIVLSKPTRQMNGRGLMSRGNGVESGMRVEILDGVKCFHYDKGEYRCFSKFADTMAVVVIHDLESRFRDQIDLACPTLKRALSKQYCWYNISFDVVGIGTDHMQTMRMYIGKNAEVSPTF